MSTNAAFWDGMAEHYAARPVEDPEAFERKIAITKGLMRPDGVVLDVGCGTGSLALILAPCAREVHGLDVSGEMIRIAREKAEKQGIDNAIFHVGAFDEFDGFDDGSLDGICAYSILHLVENRPAALAKIYRWLEPGGFFVASTVCLGDSWVPYRPMLALMHWAGKAPRVGIVGRDTLAAEIRAAGFVDVELPDVGAKPTIAFTVCKKPKYR